MTANGQPPPLLFCPGDPLPPLHVEPAFVLGSFAGQWLLLVSCGPERLAALPALIDGVQAGRTCVVRALVHGDAAPTAWTFADVDGSAADAMGALLGPEGRAAVAALIDPAGRVQVAAEWRSTRDLVEALRAAGGASGVGASGVR